MLCTGPLGLHPLVPTTWSANQEMLPESSRRGWASLGLWPTCTGAWKPEEKHGQDAALQAAPGGPAAASLGAALSPAPFLHLGPEALGCPAVHGLLGPLGMALFWLSPCCMCGRRAGGSCVPGPSPFLDCAPRTGSRGQDHRDRVTRPPSIRGLSPASRPPRVSHVYPSGVLASQALAHGLDRNLHRVTG